MGHGSLQNAASDLDKLICLAFFDLQRSLY